MKLKKEKSARYNKVESTLQKASGTALQSTLKNKTSNKALSNLTNSNAKTVAKVAIFRKHFVHNKSITEMMDIGGK
jgi:hypothetical protein